MKKEVIKCSASSKLKDKYFSIGKLKAIGNTMGFSLLFNLFSPFYFRTYSFNPRFSILILNLKFL